MLHRYLIQHDLQAALALIPAISVIPLTSLDFRFHREQQAVTVDIESQSIGFNNINLPALACCQF